jgi:hypothetical protein
MREEKTVWSPLAHVAVRDPALRADLLDALRREGWAVVDSPSGFHLLQSISRPILGRGPWCCPALLVIDAFSPGCAGVTIASGLRDLGWTVPTLLVAATPEQRARVTEAPEHHLYVASPEMACAVVVEMARHRLAPIRHAVEPADRALSA